MKIGMTSKLSKPPLLVVAIVLVVLLGVGGLAYRNYPLFHRYKKLFSKYQIVRAKERYVQTLETIADVNHSSFEFWVRYGRYPSTLADLIEKEPSVTERVKQVALTKAGKPVNGYFYTYASTDANHYVFKATPVNPTGNFQALSASETGYIMNQATGIPVRFTQAEWQAKLAQSSNPLPPLETQTPIPTIPQAQLDQVADGIRSITPASINLVGVSVKRQAILVKGSLHAEPGKEDMGQLEHYRGLLKELSGVTSVDIENVQRSSENGVPITGFTLSVWLSDSKDIQGLVSPESDTRISTLLDLFTQVAQEEDVKLLSVEPHPFVGVGEPKFRDVDVHIKLLGTQASASAYIKHIERLAQGCRTGADAILESRFHEANTPVSVVFNCNLPE